MITGGGQRANPNKQIRETLTINNKNTNRKLNVNYIYFILDRMQLVDLLAFLKNLGGRTGKIAFITLLIKYNSDNLTKKKYLANKLVTYFNKENYHCK